MTIRPAHPPDPVQERRQRTWELELAMGAARTLQERLEMLDDRPADVAVVHSLRDSLARDLGDVGRAR